MKCYSATFLNKLLPLCFIKLAVSYILKCPFSYLLPPKFKEFDYRPDTMMRWGCQH